MGLLPVISSSTAYTIPIISTTFSGFANYKSPAPFQTVSSGCDMDSEPSPPAEVSAIPCLFTVEQFQQAPSQETDRQPTNVYIVRPTAIWDSVERIKEVVSTYTEAPHPPTTNTPSVEDEHYRMHDIIAVTRHDLPQSPIWSAHILEIRAHKTSGQVFIRVFWFYEPSQLPASLRHPYHGRRELVASNSMAVINATAVASRAHVSHWHEEHEPVPAAGLFWRQTYDEQAQRLGVRAQSPPAHEISLPIRLIRQKAVIRPLPLPLHHASEPR
ncbi:MAG: hypothetical protein ALECFALPRED_008512 [Alectoria fallacina]|uniref:BAH domain-containing protein n=1 Tax=Alectoria fallacina TaxID=1903189 RepID=A0A8H3J3Z9_9LECA|nr:MAG: hypothetical protein ALECFALPRED_008512 [Alectoria fallacina]